MKQAMVVVNPSSGKESGPDYTSKLIQVIKDQYDTVTIKQTRGDGDAQAFAQESAEQGYDALYLVGGDGTINEGINGIANQDHRPVVGLVPLGTVNNASSMLGFAKNYDQAIQQFADVKTRKMDIGQVNDSYFVSSVVTGVLAASVKDVSAESKTQLGPFAYIQESLSAFGDDSATDFSISIDGEESQAQLSLIVVSVGNALLRLQNLFPEASIDDGCLNLVALEVTNLGEKMGLISQILTTGVQNSDKLDYIRCHSCQIKALKEDKDHGAIVDGDFGPELPLDIKVLPQHIEVFVPNEAF